MTYEFTSIRRDRCLPRCPPPTANVTLRRASRSVSIALLIGPAALTACKADGEGEDLAERGEAIVNGITDTEFGASYPGSVMLELRRPAYVTEEEEPDDELICSGTLISPRWVLTAGHCVDHTKYEQPATEQHWRIYVSPFGWEDRPLVIDQDDRTFHHTKLKSGTIPYLDPPTDPLPIRDEDLALIRLDEPVPHPVGVPATLPTAGECGLSFWGRLVGFSVSTESQYLKGMLWTSVRDLNPSVAALPPSELFHYAATLGSGNASWRFAMNSPRVFAPVHDWIFCASCPMGYQNPLVEVGNPDWRVTVTATSIRFDAPDAVTRAHYEDVAAGKVTHVAASEPLGMLPRAYPRGESFVRSVGVSGNTIVTVLTAAALDVLPLASSFSSTATVQPATAQDRGLAYSATEERLYMFGGTDRYGAAMNEGWFFDMEPRLWRRFAFPQGESVGAVRTAIYRYEDRSIYFVDSDGKNLRLRRWNAQRSLDTGVIQTLATLPASWMTFAKLALVAGVNGTLTLAGWNGSTSTRAKFARLSVDRAGSVSQASVYASPTTIAGTPLAAGEGVYSASVRAAAPNIPVGAFVAWNAFSAPTKDDELVLHAH